MIRVVGSRHKKNEEVKKLLLTMADHEVDTVRRSAMNWFLTSFGAEVEGTFEKVLEKLEKDPSMDVRVSLCRRLYGSSDKRAIPVLKKYLQAKDTDKKLFAACFNGAINAWTGFPQPKVPSQDAYKLVLSILNKKPRDKDHPPWSGIRTLRAAKMDGGNSFQEAWQGKVKGWYKPKALTGALTGLALDKDSNWMARTGAIETLVNLGAGKKELEAIKAKYEGAKGSDGHVVRTIDRLIKKMDKAG